MVSAYKPWDQLSFQFVRTRTLVLIFIFNLNLKKQKKKTRILIITSMREIFFFCILKTFDEKV